jgi:hypothetical protein
VPHNAAGVGSTCAWLTGIAHFEPAVVSPGARTISGTPQDPS